jgi:hypothetical protein
MDAREQRREASLALAANTESDPAERERIIGLTRRRTSFEREYAEARAESEIAASAFDVDALAVLLPRLEDLRHVIAAARAAENAALKEQDAREVVASFRSHVEAAPGRESARQRVFHVGVVRNIDRRLRSFPQRPPSGAEYRGEELRVREAEISSLKAERERVVRLYGYQLAELYSFGEQRLFPDVVAYDYYARRP